MLIMGCNSHNQFVFKTMRIPVKLDVNVNYFNELFLTNIIWDQIRFSITRRKIRKSSAPNEQHTFSGVLRVAIAPKMILRITDDPTIYLKLFDEHQLADVLLPQGGHAALPGAERGTEAREVCLLSSEETSAQRGK